ncbi:outer membrane beta-barrel protein [Flagellimonas flava]|uniref:Putative beta-barrel porin-2, OmpL-like. bbp2 n=1 Tax=Flagellimonas flava TaxID=570519 RepID=A0A1M5HM15_9FLAO|nr:outer membrane beta-barrel protein [Allomuricauda flava]SHG16985.1 Putative beta-barrel porin-2, OmpL-like. bbp2 [Allomuricauda flava]
MKTIINTKYIKNLAFATLALVSLSTFAQEEEEAKPKFEFSGTVDAYFRANLNGLNKVVPNTAVPGADFQPTAPGSSFANDPGFALGMVNLIAGYEGEKVGFVADLVFGPRGEDAVFGSPFGSPNIVNQLYVYWNVSESTTLTFGNFNTFLGYEVISPAANFNYSTSYMFSYGPFSHAGLKADFDLGNDWSAMLAILNPTDFTDINPFGEISFGAQLGYSGQYLNLLYGKQGPNEVFDGAALVDTDVKSLFQIDYTGGFDLSEDFFLGINATYQDTDGAGFYGAALYPQLTTSENFAIGLRGEYFATMEGFGNATGIGADADGDANVFTVTLTGNAKVGDLTIIPEIRLDSTSEEVFLDSDLELNDSLASFLLAAVYSF